MKTNRRRAIRPSLLGARYPPRRSFDKARTAKGPLGALLSIATLIAASFAGMILGVLATRSFQTSSIRPRQRTRLS